ncbi:TetR/AcrR family transcriptional regulator [Aquibacillus koreensis]|uniref:TetR/AcrR family transcriptional regulator n=1 Tax=Aquibacillus koreensis TaxID=279446 RepID=A0A9X4AJC7_9BACI|nr:TetR/AcrR family transcriptional regulator [Aquibacillus koreensis]MCT2536183.1 TetR/AcrR family transcriptional regulator [Aquibacillus koreensis]MDC3422107.1 TetR/AcrR family transcriptional regulator [Aquibacillus koreensis]
MDKRKNIIEAAMKLFAAHGYFSTSMQEIASECGMSKGSLYNSFESKEDLLLQVFQYNHENMMKRAQYITIDTTILPKEKLRRLLVVEFEGILQNKEYFNLLSTSLPNDKRNQFRPLIRRMRAEMMNWHKDMIQQAYTEKVNDHVWDIVITIHGVLKEFIQFKIQEKIEIEPERVAAFLLFNIDAMINHEEKPSPVIPRQMMKSYETFAIDKNVISSKEQMAEVLERVKQKSKTIKDSEKSTSDLIATASLLEEELDSKEPRKFLIDALLTYVEEIPVLEQEIKEIRILLDVFDHQGG